MHFFPMGQAKLKDEGIMAAAVHYRSGSDYYYYPAGGVGVRAARSRRTNTFLVFGGCLLALVLLHFWYGTNHPPFDDLLESQLSSTSASGSFRSARRKWSSGKAGNVRHGFNKQLVVSSVKQDDVSWLAEHLPDWESNIYVANDLNATLRPPANKGHEAMIYLSYLIDNYEDLPDVIVFIHSLRYQWHNDDPMYDGVPMLKRFNTTRVLTDGYVNLRCTHILGCPAEHRPKYAKPGGDSRAQTELAIKEEFHILFPNETMPEVIGASCCAQFAVSRDRVRVRPLSDYVRFRDWLLLTSLPDSVSGRVFEYTWHIIFGMPAVHCPNAQECYCKTFGLCDLECDYGNCKGRYVQPPFINMPPDWPNNPQPGWGIHDDM